MSLQFVQPVPLPLSSISLLLLAALCLTSRTLSLCTDLHAIAPTCVHIGGIEGPLEDEALLAETFGKFGTVLAVTLRIRREVRPNFDFTRDFCVTRGVLVWSLSRLHLSVGQEG